MLALDYPPVYASAPGAVKIQDRVYGFEEPLVPSADTSASEDAALQTALQRYDPHTSEGLQAFDVFLARYPHSAWRLAILTNLGLAYYHEGYFSKAMDALEKSFHIGQRLELPNTATRALTDRAVSELIHMYARLGYMDQLAHWLKEIEGRPLWGANTQAVADARQGLWAMRNKPGTAFLCGPKALRSLASLLPSPTPDQLKLLDDYQSKPGGMSLSELGTLAQKAGLPYRPACRVGKAPIPVPSVIHWKVNHYAAIVGEQNGRYHIQDPTYGADLWISRAAIESESSGFFMVPNHVRAGWREITQDERQSVHGMGYTETVTHESDGQRLHTRP